MYICIYVYMYICIYVYIIIIIIMSSSGATGGDQCNRRRLREQPHLKVMPTDARQKSAGTGQGRPGWRRLESTTMEVYTPAHTPKPRNISSADRLGRQLSMRSRHQYTQIRRAPQARACENFFQSFFHSSSSSLQAPAPLPSILHSSSSRQDASKIEKSIYRGVHTAATGRHRAPQAATGD